MASQMSRYQWISHDQATYREQAPPFSLSWSDHATTYHITLILPVKTGPLFPFV